MFNKLVIEIAVTCYIFKIIAHKRNSNKKSIKNNLASLTLKHNCKLFGQNLFCGTGEKF